MKEIGIVMAAGMGQRMLPITAKTPKPLVRVHGVPMIETLLNGLYQRGIAHAYVVVGYKKEQFAYLTKKYANLTLIENTEYQHKNNISSLYAVCDILGTDNCFICEGDLYLLDPSILSPSLPESCYYGKYVAGSFRDWAFDVQNGTITRIGIFGCDTYAMVGISYFQATDAKILANAINRAYCFPEHAHMYWDEIANQLVQDCHIRLGIHPINSEAVVEIDTLHELQNIDHSY